MNKTRIFWALTLVFSVSTFTFAREQPIELKKGCIKDHPIVAGETDPDLLNIYSQICDKKNKKNIVLQHELSIQAAQKFQAMGKNLKALQLVDQLREQNVQHSELTDVAFLAGIAIAENSLQHMRSQEMRYLKADSTYPAAKQLSDHIQHALPEPDTSDAKAITTSSIKQKKSLKINANNRNSDRHSASKESQLSRSKTISTPNKSVKKTPINTIAATKPQNGNPTVSGSSPFASFK
ncbi:hypothetical protein [Acinetobacter bouvetii]|uniref:Uncharacterized protein n=1 Tax=Acinetobacter bouvetii TaxID=202951 RepID=A0A811GE62_9GAMM|nr:hypothetical protein [Acinetobacter bouvetii]CAB1221466.1 hypothetical protein SFB21_2807 [Acinetobacter bouvetii]